MIDLLSKITPYELISLIGTVFSSLAAAFGLGYWFRSHLLKEKIDLNNYKEKMLQEAMSKRSHISNINAQDSYKERPYLKCTFCKSEKLSHTKTPGLTQMQLFKCQSCGQERRIRKSSLSSLRLWHYEK